RSPTSRANRAEMPARCHGADILARYYRISIFQFRVSIFDFRVSSFMIVQGKRVLVVGLARSGLSVAHALARRGAVVTVSDGKPPSEFRDVLPELVKAK